MVALKTLGLQVKELLLNRGTCALLRRADMRVSPLPRASEQTTNQRWAMP
jgi:hypothetical protein